ncbi:MAG: D-2-hydroxyacid dehydrogenase [Verrucomicrobiota bacterium]
MQSLSIYCNADLPDDDAAFLARATAPHRLIRPEQGAVGVLGAGPQDPRVDEADVVFGQPDLVQIIDAPRLAWVHLTSAGYTRYDRPDLRRAFADRGAALTKSSLVYDEPCALHVLAFMCAHARQLPAALESQRGARDWPHGALRARSRLLRDETAVIVGLGSIGRRLVELLSPLRLRLSALRRRVVGDEPIPTFSTGDPAATADLLAEADHVINILPDSPATQHFFGAARFAGLKPGAVFYNIGRGATVDENALHAVLVSGRLGAAYLDVTSSEPLPVTHPLWVAPHCFITPHTAGGHDKENLRLIHHFLDNLARFTTGRPLLDRVF